MNRQRAEDFNVCTKIRVIEDEVFLFRGSVS